MNRSWREPSSAADGKGKGWKVRLLLRDWLGGSRRYRNFLRLGEIGVNGRHDLSAIADRRCNALYGRGPHITDGEDAATAGFQGEAVIARFYAGELSLADKARILTGKPPVPLGPALKAIAG